MRSSRRRAMQHGGFVPAHFSIMAEAQRDAGRCAKCGGPERIAMKTFPGGGYELHAVCDTCPPVVPAEPLIPRNGVPFMSARTIRQYVTAGLLVFVVLLGMGLSEAHCSEVTKPAAIYLGLSAADLASTRYALDHGAVEGNAFMTRKPVPKQLALAGLLTFADVKLKRPGQKRALRITVTVIRLAAVAINVRNARRGN